MALFILVTFRESEPGRLLTINQSNINSIRPAKSRVFYFMTLLQQIQQVLPTNPSIAIQGEAGSFHDEAASLLFQEAYEPICCATFRDVASAAVSLQADAALMAIENSLAGSILPNYELLLKHDLRIVGELYLQIRQQLLANPGVSVNDIREVHSHPMALQQCTPFLDAQGWKLVEAEDTAGSARFIARHHSKHQAAIASARAAKLYGLQILAPDIHALQHNITRFLLVVPSALAPRDVVGNKQSIYFRTRHEKGSLANVLLAIAQAGFNLSKLQSFPIPDTDWQYGFYADLESPDPEAWEAVQEKLTTLTDRFQILGVYTRGQRID